MHIGSSAVRFFDGFRTLVALTALAWAACVNAGPVDAAGRKTRTPADAASASPDTAQGREFRAGVQAQLKGDLAAAKLRFEAALKLDPGAAPPLLGLASVAQAQGDAKAAEQFVQQAEKSAPKSPEVHQAWARLHAAAGRLDLAEASLLKARQLAPNRVEVLLDLGDISMQGGKMQQANKAYADALTLDGKNKFALYGLGVSAAALGRRDEAQRAFTDAAAAAPKDPAPLRASGRLHLESRAYGKALAAFDKGLVRQPSFLPLMLDRTDALVGLQRPADAIAQALAAQKLAPQSGEVQLKLADTYQAAGGWNDAEAHYLKAIAFAPRHPSAYNNLAWMTVERKGDAAKAVAWARKAVELSPNSSPFHDTLGWAERATGNLAGAATSLAKAVALESNVAGYHYHLGVVQNELKQTAAARASLQKALELNPNLPESEDARRLLKSLQGA